MIRTSCLAFALFGAVLCGAQTPSPHHPTAAVAHYGKLPLRFEQNQGQTDASVKFLSRGSHSTVLLQPSVATIVLHDAHAAKAGRPQAETRETVRMTLAGADASARMTAEGALPGYVNYMTSSDAAHWRLGVPTFAAARVAKAYPGIDVVYYGTDGQLEYDFVVAPKADPSAIHLAIEGAHPVLEQDGSLRLQIASNKHASDVVVRKPVVYQQFDGMRKPVASEYQIAANGDVRFALGAYDRSHELVIDPVISYASYFGGSGEDEINASALNAQNQLYAVGQTYSTALPATAGEFQTGSVAGDNGHDAFVHQVLCRRLAGTLDDLPQRRRR